jgi:hypothetical protein
MRFAPFLQIQVLRRHVTPLHRRSVLHGNPNFAPLQSSELSRIGKSELMVGRVRTALERSQPTDFGHRAIAGSHLLASGVIGIPP